MIITSKVFPHRSCDVVVQGFSDGIVKFLTGDIGTVWPGVRFAFDEYFAGTSPSGNSEFDQSTKALQLQ